MSWALFNHNTQFVPFGFSPPDEGSEIDAEVIYTEPTVTADTFLEGMMGVSNDGRIMVVPGGNSSKIMLSLNQGDSWSEVGAVPRTGGYRTMRIIHDPVSDNWFLCMYWSSDRSFYIYRSADNGANWSVINTTGIPTYGTRCFVIAPDGALLVSGRRSGSNVLVIRRYPNPTTSNSFTEYDFTGTASNCNNMQLLSGYVIVNEDSGSSSEAWSIPLDISTAVYLGVTGSSYPWSSDGQSLVMASKTSTAVTTTTYSKLGSDTLSPFTETSISHSSILEAESIGRGPSYFLNLAFLSGDNTIGKLVHTLDGDSYTSGVTLNLGVTRKDGISGNSVLVRSLGGAKWVAALIDSANKLNVIRFDYGVDSGASADRSLLIEIQKQAPDIFYRLDDTGSPTSVLDIGRAGYPNVTSGAITFEETGLVSDNGTAALFGAGKIRATVTSSSPTWTVDKSRPPIVNGMANDGGQIYEGSAVGSLIATAIGGVRYVSSEVYGQILGLAPAGGADNHVHLFILSHDNTAATRLLVSYGDAFKLELTTDHKLKFTAGAETLTSTSAITTDTATLALLSIEKYGGKVNLYIEDGHEGVDTFTLSAPSVESVVLGGQWDGSAYTGDASGVTIDYYAMIPFANADIGALQDAWGVTATPPAAPSVGVGSARLLVKADTAPVIRNYFSTELNQWMQVYGIPNSATGAQDVHSWIDGGAGVVDLADGKFGSGSLSIPGRSYLQSYLPHMEPAWVGFHDLALGTRDFTFAAWVKPMNSDGEAYVVSSQPYYRRNGVWYRFAGFTLSIGYDATGATGGLRLTVGHTLDDALGGPSLKDAFQRQWVGFSGFAYNQWNYVTLCRKNKQWYAMIGGRRHTSLTRNSGNQDAPVIMEPRFRSMFFGKALIAHDGNTKLGSDAKAVKIDDAVFILDEALYTQEFTPPTSAFVIA